MKKNFLRLLAAYAPTSQNKASYDEHVTNYVKKLGVDEIKIENGLFEQIFKKFKESKKSIIISGSAGDGKTYLLRKFFELLSEDFKLWKEYMPQVEYEGYTINFIKDFTEISKELKIKILRGLYQSIYEEDKNIFIIAANDGILTDSLREFITENKTFNDLLNLIEDHIDNPGLEGNLLLLELSQTSSANNFRLLLEAVLDGCDKYESECPSLSDSNIFCPIHSNIKLLKQKHVQIQLLTIIRSCDLNYNHITLRKLFMLISNMILGFKGEKKIFTSCEMAIEHFKNPSKLSDASYYSNVFGDNLSKSKQDQSPFKELRELRIGYETTNNIDNFILFGDLNSEVLHKERLENPFLDFNAFNGVKENYLNEGEDNSKRIQEYLIFLRRHLYFNYTDKIEWEDTTLNSKDLIAYEHSEKFYNQVISPLKENNRIDKHLIKELALGLNRIFLGELLSKDGNDRLFIASSLTGTTSKLSSEILTSIVFNQKHINQGIKLKLFNGFDNEYCKVNLEIEFNGSIIAKLELDLHMFEFLERIADGILPTSFSVEYYERVLTFKSQIVNYILKNQEIDSSFNLFNLNDSEVTLQYDEIQVGDDCVRES